MALALSACEPAAPPGPPRIGVPDAEHGAITDGDIDGDGIANDADNCPSIANADQREVCDYLATPPAPTGDDNVDGLDRLNYWRNIVGLDPVESDPMLTAGCVAHVAYMDLASTAAGEIVLPDTEEEGAPGYSAEGAAAAAAGLLGYAPPNGAAAVNIWLDLVLHRLPLLHPGLRRIGFGYQNGFMCVRVDQVDASVRSHPVLWPPGDSAYANAEFPGGEMPCLNWADPTMGTECMPSAVMPSVGLYGSVISDVTGSMTRVDTAEEVMLQALYFDGGPSDIERGGLVDGSIVLATPEGSMIAPTEYEVRVDATVDGAPETYRWRFRAGPAVDQDVACDVFRLMNYTFERAVDVTAATFHARLCEDAMFYRLRDAGTYRVSLDYDPRFGDLELHVYDGSRIEISTLDENDGHEVFDMAPGPGYIEIRGREGGVGGYVLLIEAL